MRTPERARNLGAIWQGVLAGYLAVVAVSGLADLVGPRVALALSLLAVGAQAGTAAWLAATRAPVESGQRTEPPR